MTNLPATIDNEDAFTAALRAAGLLSQASGGGDFHRIKVSGQNFMYGDEIIASYNAKTKEPAFYCQVAGPLNEYQAMWFDGEGTLSRAIDQPGLPTRVGTFCKSHFDDPNEARRKSDKGYSCDECPVHPFVPIDQLPPEADGKRCSWKADIEFFILDKDDEGNLVRNDDTLYTMTLPTTAVIEFKGSTSKKANPLAGSVSPENTMVRLAKLGAGKWGEEGILKARTLFELGGMICEVRPLPTKSNGGAFSFNVVSFNPIDILEEVNRPKLETADESTGTTDDDDIPF